MKKGRPTKSVVLRIWPTSHDWSIIIWPFLGTPDRLVILSQARSQPFMMILTRSCQRRKIQLVRVSPKCFSAWVTWGGVKRAVWGLSGGLNQLTFVGEASSIFSKKARCAHTAVHLRKSGFEPTILAKKQKQAFSSLEKRLDAQ